MNLKTTILLVQNLKQELTELLSLITEAVRPAADDPFPEV
jgi:hypothetical protein